MKIIACLGNPGQKYIKNRHNAGAIAGRYIAREYGISIKKKSFSSLCGTGKIDAADVLLLFPETYMNNSGKAVNAAMQYYNEDPASLIVLHDEIELPFGEYKKKFGGGHKGHNGIRSIIQETGTPDFHRLRIGVGRPGEGERTVADYVLSDFTKEELLAMETIAPDIINLVKSIITGI